LVTRPSTFNPLHELVRTGYFSRLCCPVLLGPVQDSDLLHPVPLLLGLWRWLQDWKQQKIRYGTQFRKRLDDKKNTTTTKFVNSDTGLKFFYFLNREKTFSTSVTYNFISKAKYNDGTNNVELRGTSLKADISYNVWLWENSALALKLIYYKPTFTESVDATTLTKVNYKRTTLSPGIGFVALF
jgi:hypothetical protein